MSEKEGKIGILCQFRKYNFFLLSYKKYNTKSYKNTVSFHRSERNPSSMEIKLPPVHAVQVSYTSNQVKFFRFLILGQSM